MGEIIDKVKGKAKQIEGVITGDKARQLEGELDEAKGAVKGAVTGVVKQVEEAVQNAADAVKRAVRKL